MLVLWCDLKTASLSILMIIWEHLCRLEWSVTSTRSVKDLASFSKTLQKVEWRVFNLVLRLQLMLSTHYANLPFYYNYLPWMCGRCCLSFNITRSFPLRACSKRWNWGFLNSARGFPCFKGLCQRKKRLMHFTTRWSESTENNFIIKVIFCTELWCTQWLLWLALTKLFIWPPSCSVCLLMKERLSCYYGTGDWRQRSLFMPLFSLWV